MRHGPSPANPGGGASRTLLGRLTSADLPEVAVEKRPVVRLLDGHRAQVQIGSMKHKALSLSAFSLAVQELLKGMRVGDAVVCQPDRYPDPSTLIPVDPQPVRSLSMPEAQSQLALSGALIESELRVRHVEDESPAVPSKMWWVQPGGPAKCAKCGRGRYGDDFRVCKQCDGILCVSCFSDETLDSTLSLMITGFVHCAVCRHAYHILTELDEINYSVVEKNKAVLLEREAARRRTIKYCSTCRRDVAEPSILPPIRVGRDVFANQVAAFMSDRCYVCGSTLRQKMSLGTVVASAKRIGVPALVIAALWLISQNQQLNAALGYIVGAILLFGSVVNYVKGLDRNTRSLWGFGLIGLSILMALSSVVAWSAGSIALGDALALIVVAVIVSIGGVWLNISSLSMCPKCRSTDIDADPSWSTTGHVSGGAWRTCRSCGHRFPFM